MTATEDSPDVRAIKALIGAFFDRVNAADAQGLGALFLPKANLTIIRHDPARDPPNDTSGAVESERIDEDKLAVVLRVTIEQFVQLIEDGEKKRKGKPGPKIHEEPDLDATDIEVDDERFAAAYSPFRVYFDDKLHHYGKFVYTFGKSEKGKDWKIVDLTQKYRRSESAEDKPWDTQAGNS